MRSLKEFLYGICLSVLLSLCMVQGSWGGELSLIPRPKQIGLSGQPVACQGFSLNVSSDLKERFAFAENAFPKPAGRGGTACSIEVGVMGDKNSGSLPAKARDALKQHPEGYWLEVKKEGIRLIGADPPGAFHGFTTIQQLLQPAQGILREGTILDWPDLRTRALHLVTYAGKRRVSPQRIKEVILRAKQYKFNTIVLSLSNGIKLKSMERIVYGDSWTAEELMEVVRLARENGMQVVPELRLLTHQEKLLRDAYPSLMFNKVTYDPRQEQVYEVILPMMDELINLMRPKAVHIGHDEVAGFRHRKKKLHLGLGPGERMLPPELFLKDVKRLHAHLQSRGVETWMWGDMLISPEGFPGMLGKHLHGVGGYPALRKDIPKEIVICDWHFFDRGTDFPSAMAFARDGHRVLGSTWRRMETIRSFSRYVAGMPHGGEGMIASTWFLVQRGETELVDEIIRTSGDAYWNAK